ncbi:MAG: hypothetical protein M1820_007745 [Bogoriella megaspora]|nr:MAG: hypothetical protein M1820_007745 [Bogoriella megaspora]
MAAPGSQSTSHSIPEPSAANPLESIFSAVIDARHKYGDAIQSVTGVFDSPKPGSSCPHMVSKARKTLIQRYRYTLTVTTTYGSAPASVYWAWNEIAIHGGHERIETLLEEMARKAAEGSPSGSGKVVVDIGLDSDRRVHAGFLTKGMRLEVELEEGGNSGKEGSEPPEDDSPRGEEDDLEEEEGTMTAQMWEKEVLLSGLEEF